MSYNSPFGRGSWRRPVYGASVRTIDVDLGLRRYMLQVYNFMAAGLGSSRLPLSRLAFISRSQGRR